MRWGDMREKRERRGPHGMAAAAAASRCGGGMRLGGGALIVIVIVSLHLRHQSARNARQ